jgi:hypothetical protein
MANNKRPERSELFLVRVWTETTEAGGRLTRGKVQKAVSGETFHFDDWQGLLLHLQNNALATDTRNTRQETASDSAEQQE